MRYGLWALPVTARRWDPWQLILWLITLATNLHTKLNACQARSLYLEICLSIRCGICHRLQSPFYQAGVTLSILDAQMVLVYARP